MDRLICGDVGYGKTEIAIRAAFKAVQENKSTSPIRLSMIVDAAQAVQAVQCLHTAFGLDSDDVFVETQLSAEEIAAKMKKGR